MQRLALTCAVLAACTPLPNGSGIVAYSEVGNGNVRAYYVTTGQDWLVDGSGSFGSLAVSRDTQYIAYVGADAVVRVADMEGNVTPLAPGTGEGGFYGCSPGPTWGPRNSLKYCIYDQGFMSYGFMPALGAPVRKLLATDLAISDTASRIIYHRRDADPYQLGDVVIENADGSDQRVVQASIIETSFAFTPDGAHVAAVEEHPEGFRVVIHALADGAKTDLGVGDLPPLIEGGSRFSPDQSEMLAVLGDELVAVNLTTGAKRHFATIPSDIQIMQAAFIDVDRVIYRRYQSTQVPGSDVIESSQSIRIASGSGETTVMPDATSCYLRAIDATAGFAAVECDTAKIVAFDGTVQASNGASFALGISEDGVGMVTLAADGAVTFVKTDGELRPIAQARPLSEYANPLHGPYAAYSP